MFTRISSVELQGYTWAMIWTLISALFAAYYLLFLRVNPSRAQALRQERRPAEAKRFLSLRVCGISVSVRLDDIEEQLKTIDDVKIVRRHPLLRMDKHSHCTIIDIKTSLPEKDLLQQLNTASGQLYTYDCDFYGITPLSHYEDTQVDVIAVPGLASHAFGSWKSPGKSDNWLRDWLPYDVPNVRLLLYGYETTLLKSHSRKSIDDMGKLFLEEITAFRAGKDESRRPIIFIGHSLGGLLIKEALVHASRKPQHEANKVRKACCGLVFFGVPNHGLRNEQLQTVVEGQPNQALIRDLVVDEDSEPSAFLKRIAYQFSECCKGQCRVVSFLELKKSPTVQRHPDGRLHRTGPETLMVTRDSATSTGLTATSDEDNIGLDTDHSGLVKYNSRSHGPYPIVKGRLRSLVVAGIPQVERRFTDSAYG